ncbi:WXG100 family type VII secretion target [Amycolatopsis viridis]|uniref:Uncharacterized protein YukE n=1 Tax=Amycolatopsis viridis TaxID=185678 RepID=A0ABX0T1P2_9PSEU|nr:WXG100 family type VII secretion target [Amycolatopsis viridis]NIH81471.1 uncharacterized protein YukE [Amycolatopsis viridis]
MDNDLKYTHLVGDAGSGNVQKAQDLETLFDDFATQAKGILGNDWQGFAAHAFQEAHHDWNKNLVEYATGRAHFGKKVIEAMERAFESDNRAAGFFS